jgi:hypothetical protein
LLIDFLFAQWFSMKFLGIDTAGVFSFFTPTAIAELLGINQGGRREIFVDKVNGSDSNDGLIRETAYATWDKCLAVMHNYADIVLYIYGFTQDDVIYFIDYPAATKRIIIMTDVTAGQIFFSSLVSLQVLGAITTQHLTLNVIDRAIFSDINITSGPDALTNPAIEIDKSNALFTGNVNIVQHKIAVRVRDGSVATFTHAVIAPINNANAVSATIVEASAVSTVRFFNIITEVTVPNINLVQYNIEDGSEVYVAGWAKHFNPYVIAPQFDPGEGAPLRDGHLITVYQSETPEDRYVFPTEY